MSASAAKPTFRQIADLAGVGTATVERVLNGRGGVRPATAARVIVAARQLDWPGRLPGLHRGLNRIEVVLVRPDSNFYARLARAFRRIGATLDPAVQVQITFLDEGDTAAQVRHIARPERPRAALVIAAPDIVGLRDALGQVIAGGLPVVQVVTRIVPDAAYVGIDNRAAGRMAGLCVGRLANRAGPVIALCHSPGYEVHRMRLQGFSDYLARHPAADRPFVHLAFHHDSRDLARRRLHEILEDWPDVAAIYNAGGGNTAVLDLLGQRAPGVFFVGHELSDVSEAALRNGVADVILDQAPEAQARRAIDLVLVALGLTDQVVDNPPIRFTTITAETL